MGKMNHLSKLNKLLDSGEAVISIVVPVRERQNVLRSLYDTLTFHLTLPVYLWNLGDPEHFRIIECGASDEERVVLLDGFEVGAAAEVTPGSNALAALKSIKNSDTNGVFILENIPSCMQEREGAILRQLLINISSDITAQKTSKFLILLVTDEVELPASLSGLIESLELPYPDVSELENLISTYLPTLIGATVGADLVQSLATAAAGLHTEDIKAGLRQAVLDSDGFPGNDVSLVRSLLDYKINRFRSFNLNFVPEPNVHDFGGLDNLKRFIQDAKRDFQTDARAANIPLPKGCLLVGSPGTGKTLAANVSARELGFPLVSIDTGAIVAGGVMYLKRLLNRVEACAPVVLYFDELDKLFTALTVSGEDSGSRHILGILLTWLQDKRSAVFVVATLNRLDVLPPELTRVGRFDEIFYVGFPNAFERKQIISLHAARFDERYRDGGDSLTQQEWKIILNKTVNCTGAELARMVEKAARSLFHSGKPMVIDLPILLQQRDAIVPLYMRDTDRILAIENRARGFAQPASSPDCSEYAPPIKSYWGD
jgi:ATP-dependent 26S proteasome regulatory subunit